MSGLYIEGRSMGIRTEPAREVGKPPKVLAGVAFQKYNGFIGQDEVIEVTLDANQVASGHMEKWKAFSISEQPIRLSVTVRNNSFNGKVYTTYYAQGEPVAMAPVEPLQQKPALQAAK